MLCLGWGHPAINVAIHHHNRRQGAAAKTSNPLQTELIILGGLSWIDAELSLHCLQDAAPATHMASGALADLDHVLAWSGKAKLGIEGGHTVNLALGNGEEAGNFRYRLLRDIAKFTLNLLQNGN